MAKVKQKHQQRIQWVVVLTAVAAGLAEASHSGILPESVTIYLLLATNVISAILRSAVGTPTEE